MKNIRKNAKHARTLNLTLDEYDELINRMVGYLKKRPINRGSISDSLFIYAEIITRKKLVQKEKWITSNDELREYGTEIEQLRLDGKGYGTIKSELSLKVSRATIGTFCKDNNLQKEDTNG